MLIFDEEVDWTGGERKRNQCLGGLDYSELVVLKGPGLFCISVQFKLFLFLSQHKH